MQFRIHLNIDTSEIILYLQTNSYQLKKKNINSPIFISTISNSIQDGKLGQKGRGGRGGQKIPLPVFPLLLLQT